MKRLAILLAVLSLLAAACGSSSDQTESSPATSSGGLSAFEVEHGIGPVKQPIELGAPDAALAAEGDAVFRLKCMACHRVADRYIGPPLGDVLDRRSPTYVMNMMLNPTEMTERHPAAKALLAEYLAPMPNQDLTQQEARAVLEYLRLASDSTHPTEQPQ